MFIDADFDYSVVQQFFDEHVKPFFDDMEMYDSYANNHPVVRTITLSRVLFNY